MIILNLNSEIPIYTQLRNQIIQAIAKGEIALGESMPTVRQLAEDLGINNMTVNKSYAELKHLGYLETNLRKGTVVKAEITEKPDFLDKISDSLSALTAEAFLNGISREQFLHHVNVLYDQYKEV